MEKIFRYLQRITFFVVVIIPALAIPYYIHLRWGFFRDTFPLPAYLQVIRILTPTIACSFYIFFPTLFVLCLLLLYNKKLALPGILLFIATLLGIPMCCIFSYIALSFPETILNSAQLDHHHYYLTVQGALGEHFTDYYLYKCNEKDLKCKSTFVYLGGGSIEHAALIVDNHTHEIHIYLNHYISDELIYTYGPYPHEYTFEDGGKIDKYLFDLYSYETNSVKEFVITKCDEDHENISCEIIPFRYSTKVFKDAKIVSDEAVKEIRVLIDDKLVFSYDTAPHCYVDDCIIPGK